MKDFKGKTAVITGAASGIGEAMAHKAAGLGMNVVLSDIEAPKLEKVAGDLSAFDVEVLPVVTDTSSQSSVFELADAAFSAFDHIHLLHNNAGVSGVALGHAWEITDEEWQWVMGVNWYGVLYGVQAFVPKMIAGGEEGVVINTSSIMGLNTGRSSPYNVSKHAVARFTEGLYYDLKVAESKVTAALLCPGPIATEIVKSERNRPTAEAEPRDPAKAAEIKARREAMYEYLHKEGIPPSDVAEMVFDHVARDEFYILTHPDLIRASFRRRAKGIDAGNPLPLPGDYVAEAKEKRGD